MHPSRKTKGVKGFYTTLPPSLSRTEEDTLALQLSRASHNERNVLSAGIEPWTRVHELNKIPTGLQKSILWSQSERKEYELGGVNPA